MSQRPLRPAAGPRAVRGRRCSQRSKGRRAGRTLVLGLILGLGGLLSGTVPAAAASLEDIRQLEDLINAAGVVTQVSDQCPASHAGFYERDSAGRHRLVLCRNVVNLADVEAV